MNLTAERDQLVAGVGRVMGAVKKSSIAIRQNLLLAAGDGVLNVSGTDGDLEVCERVGALVVEEGAITVEASTFHDMLRGLASGADVDLQVTGKAHRLSLHSGRTKFTLPTLPAADFPSFPLVHPVASMTCRANALARLIDKTVFCVSTDDARFHLHGVNFHPHLAQLRAAATNGFKLAVTQTPFALNAGDTWPAVTIPTDAVKLMRRLLEDATDTVDVQVSDYLLRFNYGKGVLQAKLLDGSFADYERAVPKGDAQQLTLPTKALSEAVRRVAIVATDKSTSLRFELSANRIALSSQSADRGDAEEELACTYDGPDMRLGFNGRMLAEALGKIDGPEVTLSLRAPDLPVVISDPKDPSSFFLSMPLRA